MDKEQYKQIKTSQWKREQGFIYACEVCSKSIRRTDGDYSKYKWQKVVCYEHSPLGGIEKSSDSMQRMKDTMIMSLPKDATEEQIERANELLRSVSK